MHDDPRPTAPDGSDAGPSVPPVDPTDLTQRHGVPPTDPAVEPSLVAPITPGAPDGNSSPVDAAQPASTWTPAPSEDGAVPFDRFTPAPESRPAWARSFDATPPVTPERWYEPAPAPTPATQPVAPGRTRSGTGSILAVSLLAAVLASGGTVLALSASGALDRPVVQVPATSQASNAGTVQPVTIDESSATIAVAAKVSPAVVRIRVTGAASGNLNVIPATGVGSGVIFDSHGWILTNHHVVEGGEKFDVELLDGRKLSGTVYGIDTLTDLAIVKVDATDLPSAALGESDALKVGQLVIAIGSPLGTYSNSVTSGIVSAKGRSIVTDGSNQQLTNLIQTDAAINPGNSGGPLLDAGGNVIGINTAIATNSNGIGFAIPIDIAKPIMAQAVAGQPLSRPYMGIHFVSITRQLADAQKLPVNVGALVGGTDANGDPRRRRRPRDTGRQGRHQGRRHHRQRRTARSSTRSIRSTPRCRSSSRARRSASTSCATDST